MVANGNKAEFTGIELEMCRKEKLGKLHTNWMEAIAFFLFLIALGSLVWAVSQSNKVTYEFSVLFEEKRPEPRAQSAFKTALE